MSQAAPTRQGKSGKCFPSCPDNGKRVPWPVAGTRSGYVLNDTGRLCLRFVSLPETAHEYRHVIDLAHIGLRKVKTFALPILFD